jgi:Secretion system C-terminal sorting domain/FG-GAP-like repeat
MKNLIFTYLFIITAAIVVYSSEYEVPKNSASVDVADVDLDGDLDIVLGHDFDVGTGWSGITILLNDGTGVFNLADSVYLLAGQSSIHIKNINENTYPEIFAKSYNTNEENEYLAVINNSDLTDISLFPFNTNQGINSFEINDIDLDNDIDVIFQSHVGEFWGILYNNGNGEFSEPEYYNLGIHPNDMAVGDLNGDERDDIAIGGGFRIFYNYPTHFEEVIPNLPIPPHDVLIEDVDNDGKNDIIGTDWGIPGTQKRILIYRNEGNDNFQLIYNSWIEEAMARISASDLNNDSYIDIIYNVSYSYANSNYELFHTYILFNNGDGTYEEPVDYYTGICSHKSMAADLDGDGWNDIITLNYDFYLPHPDTGTIHILFNDRTGHFVEDPVTGIEDEEITVEEFKLYQNYPNPFNPTTRIKFTIPESPLPGGDGRGGLVTLKVYDVLGNEVATLVSEEKTSGRYEINFDASSLASGIYLYRLMVNDYVDVKKMILLK